MRRESHVRSCESGRGRLPPATRQVIEKYRKQAHLPLLPHRKRGMHSLRHTLASTLLEHNTPLAVISDILGHSDTDTTAAYLKVDVNRLRECALNLEEVLMS